MAPAAATLFALTMKSQLPRMTSAILPLTADALVSAWQASLVSVLGAVGGFAALTTVAVIGPTDSTVTGLEPSRLFFTPARFAGALTVTREKMRPAGVTAAVEITDGATAGEPVTYGAEPALPEDATT